jgi:hypothetical protein
MEKRSTEKRIALSVKRMREVNILYGEGNTGKSSITNFPTHEIIAISWQYL